MDQLCNPLTFDDACAGHGFMTESDGEFMIPMDWDTSLGVDPALRMFGVKWRGEYGALSTVKDAYASIVLIDACRENLHSEADSHAVGQVDLELPDAPSTLVLFACSPKRTAAEGKESTPFSEAIRKVRVKQRRC